MFENRATDDEVPLGPPAFLDRVRTGCTIFDAGQIRDEAARERRN